MGKARCEAMWGWREERAVEEGRTRVCGDLRGAMGVKMTLTRADIVVVKEKRRLLSNVRIPG